MITLFELCGADRDIRFSPTVWRTRLNLLHKGLDFTSKPLKFLEKEPIAPAGSRLLPVIQDGDIWVKDSFDIACYLDQAYPEKPLIAGGKAAVPAARFFNNWVLTSVLSSLFPMIAIDVYRQLDVENAVYFKDTREKALGMTLEAAQKMALPKLEDLRASLQPARMQLGLGPFLEGQAPAFQDYCLMGVMAWAHTISDLEILDKKDTLYDWKERMMDLYDGHIRSAKRVGGNVVA